MTTPTLRQALEELRGYALMLPHPIPPSLLNKVDAALAAQQELPQGKAQNKDQMRADFEKWASKDEMNRVTRWPTDPNQYAQQKVQWMWEAWQAARASAPQGVPEGWQLVPVKPTAAMKAAGMEHCLHDDSDDQYRAKGQAICVYSDMLAAAPQPVAQKGQA